MNNLKDLNKLTRDLTVLYVEDSTTLLKQVSSFFKKIFKNVYHATNGLDGLEKYKEYKPDLVFTDLTMPKMDGYDMIINLKKIDSNIKIIIISAHLDTPNLLKAIHLGVSDFIPKPIDNKLLQNTLFRVASELSSRVSRIDKEELRKETDLIKRLDILHKNNTSVQFINHYRGIPIINEGHIVGVGKSTIIVHTPFIQTLAMNYEKTTMFESNLIDTAISAKLVGIDSNSREIKLNNLTTVQSSSKRRKELRVEPDKEFIAVLHIQNKKLNITTKDISLNSILVIAKLTEFYASESDDVNLSFGFKIHSNSKRNTIERSEKILCKGTIFKISKKELEVDIVILFDLGKANKVTLGRYIYQREIELIEEFKQIKDSKLI